MSNSSNKSNLSKKLKFISIASAVIMCSTISADIYRASANPFTRLFRGMNLRNPFRGLFGGRTKTHQPKNLRPTSNHANVNLNGPRPNRANPNNLKFDVDDASTKNNNFTKPNYNWDDMFVDTGSKRPQLVQSIGAGKQKLDLQQKDNNSIGSNGTSSSHVSNYNWWQK